LDAVVIAAGETAISNIKRYLEQTVVPFSTAWMLLLREKDNKLHMHQPLTPFSWLLQGWTQDQINQVQIEFDGQIHERAVTLSISDVPSCARWCAGSLM
jgi:hypothetical protein